MSRVRIRSVAWATAALLALSLTGCGGAAPAPAPTSGNPSPATSDQKASPAPSAIAALPDPHSIHGASTAASVAEVVPIATDVSPQLPVTLRDDAGTTVTVTDTSRILALDVYGTLAETIVGLGLGKNLVGRGSSNTFDSMANLPLVTQNGHELNGEAILGLSPTVVLIDTTIGPPEVPNQLRASGIPVVFFSPDRHIDTVSEQVRAVAHAVGLDAGGAKLAERVSEEIATARATIAAMAPAAEDDKLRIAFLYVRGQAGVFFLFGTGMGADDLIDALGGIDIASEAGITGVKPANSEALLATNPDLLLVMTDGLESTGGVDGMLKRPGVSETTAGQNRRIVDMSDGQVLSFGPSTAAVLLSLAQAIYAPTELS